MGRIYPRQEAGYIPARPFNCAVDRKCVFRYKKSGRAEGGTPLITTAITMSFSSGFEINGYTLGVIMPGLNDKCQNPNDKSNPNDLMSKSLKANDE